jgi:hypothetical protein
MSVFALFRESRAGLAAMPTLMRMFCGGAMLATPVLLLLMLVPLVPLQIDGQAVSRREFWESGIALVFVSFLLLGLVGSWGMALRRPGARWAAVSMPVAPGLILLLLPTSRLVASEQGLRTVAVGCAYAVAFYLCLFHIPVLKRYFAAGG